MTEEQKEQENDQQQANFPEQPNINIASLEKTVVTEDPVIEKKHKPTKINTTAFLVYQYIQVLNYKKFAGECLACSDAIKRHIKNAYNELTEEQVLELEAAVQTPDQMAQIKQIIKLWQLEQQY